MTVIYLFFVLPQRIKRHSEIALGTALHRSKDFAVSLLYLYRITPEGALQLSPLASLLAPLGLLPTGVTRYFRLHELMRLHSIYVFGLSSADLRQPRLRTCLMSLLIIP